MGSKGLKPVIVGVLILVLVMEQVQAEGKSCCKDTINRNCYNICGTLSLLQATCARICGCIIIPGVVCPPAYPEFNFVPNSDEPDRVEYCRLGCRSSVCDNMGNVMNIDVETCSEACDRFCNGNASIASTAA